MREHCYICGKDVDGDDSACFVTLQAGHQQVTELCCGTCWHKGICHDCGGFNRHAKDCVQVEIEKAWDEHETQVNRARSKV